MAQKKPGVLDREITRLDAWKLIVNQFDNQHLNVSAMNSLQENGRVEIDGLLITMDNDDTIRLMADDALWMETALSVIAHSTETVVPERLFEEVSEQYVGDLIADTRSYLEPQILSAREAIADLDSVNGQGLPQYARLQKVLEAMTIFDRVLNDL